MATHVVPVGFDYDRLIAPLARDKLDVDRVVLLEGTVGSAANVEYSRNLTAKLEKDFANLLGAETERVTVADVYDYDAAFEQAYDLIAAELDAGEAVWVNISSMPRTVSFAYAAAAHSLMVEREDDREKIHTYYTAPEKYLETELAEELRQQRDLLGDLLSDESVDLGNREPALRERHERASELIEEFDERGTTIGAKEFDGSHVLELPVTTFSNVKPFQELILFILGEHGEFESVSELASTLADELGEEYTDSFRSKVIYNVDQLGADGKGYIEQEPHGNSYRTRLSRLGQLWVRAHAENGEEISLDAAPVTREEGPGW